MSSARPPTAARRSRAHASSTPTSSSWTSECPAWTEATRRVTALDPPMRVLVLTTFDLDEYVYESLRAGASAFLLKDAPEQQLLAAIRVVADGGSLFAPSVTRRLIERFTSTPGRAQPPLQLEHLTAREREVLLLVARGL